MMTPNGNINWKIRDGLLSDGDEIARLFSELGHPASGEEIVTRWEAWKASGGESLVAVFPDRGLIGVITLNQMTVLHRPKPVGRITLLIVDASFRGRGIGKSLVEAAERRFVQRGCQLLEITSNLRLSDAHAFYEHLGYCRTSVRLAKDLRMGPHQQISENP